MYPCRSVASAAAERHGDLTERLNRSVPTDPVVKDAGVEVQRLAAAPDLQPQSRSLPQVPRRRFDDGRLDRARQDDLFHGI